MTVLITPQGRLTVQSEDPFASGYREQHWWAGPGFVTLAGQGSSATYAGLYRSQPWLAAAVNKLSRAVARLPLKTYRYTDADGNRERIRDHPIVKVIGKPHPSMGAFRLKEWIVADLALFGNSAVKVISAPNGDPLELWPIPWPLVEVVGDRMPTAYIFHPPKGPIPIPAEEVLHFRYWSPSDSINPLVGVSPVEPLRRTLLNEDAAARWSTSMFNNAGRPSGVVSTDQKLSREQITAVREELQQIYGSVDNAFRIAVMQGGLNWQQASFSAVEAGLLDLRRLNREEVAAVYDIPEPMIQILDKATFSNIDTQHRMLYMDTLAPWLILLEEELQAQLIDPVSRFDGIFTEFDLAEVLKADLPARAQAYANLRRYMSIDDIRQRENLPPFNQPWSQTVWMPINEYPLTGEPPPNAPVQQTAAQPPAAGADLLGILTQALERAERTASSHLGAGREVFQPERFARELCDDLGRVDEACRAWATNLAVAVDDAIRGSRSPSELRERMLAVRDVLVSAD